MSGAKRALRRGGRLLRNLYDTCCYRAFRGRGGAPTARRVVFVCKGNVCRSAYAEHYMRSLPAARGVSIFSCGLDVRRSDAPPLEARRVAARKGLDMEAHRSQGYQLRELMEADLILVMEYWQYRLLASLLPHKRSNIRLLREFTPFPENLLCNIDDPYGSSEAIFERCFGQIERAVAALCTQYTGTPGGST